MTLHKHADSSTPSARGGSQSISSFFPLAELYADASFQIEWDNDLPFNLARHLLRMRRYRELTQVELADLVGTSQSKIARIEGADENVTLKTLMRLADALHGRLRLSIEPAECSFPQLPPWWECLANGAVLPNTTRWRSPLVTTYQHADSDVVAVVAGWTVHDSATGSEPPEDEIVARRTAHLTTGSGMPSIDLQRDFEIVRDTAKSWS